MISWTTPWDEVHDEAERLEHFISERLEDRIAAKLGDPRNGSARTLDPRTQRDGSERAREVLSFKMGVRRSCRDQQRLGSRSCGSA